MTDPCQLQLRSPCPLVGEGGCGSIGSWPVLGGGLSTGARGLSLGLQKNDDRCLSRSCCSGSRTGPAGSSWASGLSREAVPSTCRVASCSARNGHKHMMTLSTAAETRGDLTRCPHGHFGRTARRWSPTVPLALGDRFDNVVQGLGSQAGAFSPERMLRQVDDAVVDPPPPVSGIHSYWFFSRSLVHIQPRPLGTVSEAPVNVSS